MSHPLSGDGRHDHDDEPDSDLVRKVKRVVDEEGRRDPVDTLDRVYRLDKIAAAIFVAILTFILGQQWVLKNDISAVQLKAAELSGAQANIIQNLTQLMTEGSRTAQRTEVVVLELSTRLAKIEDFVSKGPRFTKDDGDRLEKRIEKIESRLEGVKK